MFDILFFKFKHDCYNLQKYKNYCFRENFFKNIF